MKRRRGEDDKRPRGLLDQFDELERRRKKAKEAPEPAAEEADDEGDDLDLDRVW
ncbi:MAG: hypothetical protein ACPGQL_03100 [Thermoplasmatota archaeon]